MFAQLRLVFPGVSAFLISTLLLPTSSAQAFDHEWATFEVVPGGVVSDLEPISGPNDEVDLAQGDLDLDGWVDVVIVRKAPWMSYQKRSNVLLMNEGGVLVDRTRDYATASDVPGDQGFRTGTNDRDVGIADLDGDGWPDVVTVTTLQLQGEDKVTGYPRVYMNLGEDEGGNWLGIEYQEARFPLLYAIGEEMPALSNFNAVAIGDVTGDGSPDLYLAHHMQGLDPNIEIPPGNDLDDRLLINDGNGYFTDETLLRMSPLMYETTFSSAVVMGDFNNNGVNDLVRVKTGGEPETASISYNNPNDEGVFFIFDEFHQEFEPYHVEKGDLNNDGRLDVVLGDDFDDRFRLNEGNDALGRVIWGPARLFDYLTGGDESYAGNIRVGDLNNDGWDEVLVCSVDIQSELGTRRTHLYHNLGGNPGLETLVLREERAAPEDSSEWIGAVGFDAENMLESFDLLLLDVDRDGWTDVLHAGFNGTILYRNLTGEQTCQVDLGSGGPGDSVLSLCGDELGSGGDADLRLEGAVPLAPAWLALSASNTPTRLFGGTLVPFPVDVLFELVVDAEGVVHVPDLLGGGGPATVYFQAAYLDVSLPGLVGLSNAIRVEWLP